MKNIGIVRPLDQFGRVTIPIEIRNLADLCLVPLDLSIESGIIVLRKGSGRQMDDKGRYVIPAEIRRINGWATGQKLEIYAENGAICIKKLGCEWCNETENVFEFEADGTTHLLCYKHAGMVADRLLKI